MLSHTHLSTYRIRNFYYLAFLILSNKEGNKKRVIKYSRGLKRFIVILKLFMNILGWKENFRKMEIFSIFLIFLILGRF